MRDKPSSRNEDDSIDSPDGAEAADTGQVGIQSIEVGMRLLTQLAELTEDAPPPMLKTLAAAAEMAPAKVHRYMVSLVRTGYVERDPATGRYRLGPMARQIGISSIRRMDVVKTAGAHLPEICTTLKHSVGLAIWTYNGPVMVATEDARRPVTIGTRIGEVMPLLTSATGRVFGAWMPRAAVKHLIDKELANVASSRRAGGVKTMKQAESWFAQTRDIGLGWTEGGLNATVNALAAPLFDYRGTFVAALAALGPADEFDPHPDGAIAQGLRAAAATISSELGYHPGDRRSSETE